MRLLFSVLSHVGFSHRRSVPRPLFRTLHGLLLGTSAHRPCFDLSVYRLRLPALLFTTSPTSFVDSLDSTSGTDLDAALLL